MAGSYSHIITARGHLVSNESFGLENLGDAYEAIEEMYGMIWWLARNHMDPAAAVETARKNYKEGLKLAKEVNSDQRQS